MLTRFGQVNSGRVELDLPPPSKQSKNRKCKVTSDDKAHNKAKAKAMRHHITNSLSQSDLIHCSAGSCPYVHRGCCKCFNGKDLSSWLHEKKFWQNCNAINNRSRLLGNGIVAYNQEWLTVPRVCKKVVVQYTKRAGSRVTKADVAMIKQEKGYEDARKLGGHRAARF